MALFNPKEILKVGLAKKFGITYEQKIEVDKQSNNLINKISELMNKKLIDEYKVNKEIFQNFLCMPERNVKRANSVVNRKNE